MSGMVEDAPAIREAPHSDMPGARGIDRAFLCGIRELGCGVVAVVRLVRVGVRVAVDMQRNESGKALAGGPHQGERN